MIRMKTALALVVSACSVSFFAQAQSPVEERSIGNAAQPAASSNAVSILSSELLALRQEVSELRGLVEELNYKLDQQQKQRQAEYIDLDRRLQALSGTPPQASVNQNSVTTSAPSPSVPAPATPPNTQTTTPSGANSIPTSAPVISAAQVEVLYNIAFDELKQGNTEAAISGFENVVQNYPTSSYSADSLYWLGESYSLKSDNVKTQAAFTKLVDGFPAHRKTPDAAYKLGMLFHQKKDTKNAIKYLKIAASSGSAISAVAQKFLSDNYP